MAFSPSRLYPAPPHQVQVPVTHPRARHFWTSKNSVSSSPWNQRSQSSSADFIRLQRLRPAQPSLSTMQDPGIYPTHFVRPSGWSDPYSQISRRQNYHTPFSLSQSLQRSYWNPASMGLSFRLTEHARGQPWLAGDTRFTGVRWHYFPFFPRDLTNTFSPQSGTVILAGTSQKSSFNP